MLICEKNSEKIYNNHIGMIKKIAAKNTKDFHIRKDLEQEAYLILLDSIRNFKPDKKVLFSTYLYNCINRKFKTIVQKMADIKHGISDENYKLNKNKDVSIKYIYTDYDINKIKNLIIKKYNKNKKRIIGLKINGVDNSRIAEICGCTRQYVSTVLSKAEKLSLKRIE